MTSRRQKLALVASYAAVAALAVLVTVAWYPKVPSRAEEEFFRPFVEDAVGIVARAQAIDRRKVTEKYRVSLLELSDQLCIGFDRIAATVDGSNPAVCYPNTSPNKGPIFHEYGEITPVRELGRRPKR